MSEMSEDEYGKLMRKAWKCLRAAEEAEGRGDMPQAIIFYKKAKNAYEFIIKNFELMSDRKELEGKRI